MRSVSLRNLKERARFKIQEAICRGFREYLYAQGFTEIHTPKIGAKGAEGGSNMFKLSYFHTPAVLAQSPQFYKQMMVGRCLTASLKPARFFEQRNTTPDVI